MTKYRFHQHFRRKQLPNREMRVKRITQPKCHHFINDISVLELFNLFSPIILFYLISSINVQRCTNQCSSYGSSLHKTWIIVFIFCKQHYLLLSWKKYIKKLYNNYFNKNSLSSLFYIICHTNVIYNNYKLDYTFLFLF